MTKSVCFNIGEDYAETDQFVCSECGIHLQGWAEYDDDGDAHEYTFKYCPNCGAKVVEHE